MDKHWTELFDEAFLLKDYRLVDDLGVSIPGDGAGEIFKDFIKELIREKFVQILGTLETAKQDKDPTCIECLSYAQETAKRILR